jgi:AmiR/NasT family two-component response regulator
MANPAPLLLADSAERDAQHFAHSLELARLRNALTRVSDVDEAINYLAGIGSFKDRDEYPFPIVLFVKIRVPETHRLLAWLEANPGAKPAGIVALTSSEDSRPVIQAYHLGVQAFLREPVRSDDLRMALEAIPRTRLGTDQTGYWIEEAGSRR